MQSVQAFVHIMHEVVTRMQKTDDEHADTRRRIAN